MSSPYSIFYITLDPERATGIEDMLENYSIVCPYESPLTRDLEARGIAMYILERDCGTHPWYNELKRGTYGILKLPCVKEYIDGRARLVPNGRAGSNQPNILVLKTSELIERECKKSGWRLLAPPASSATFFEDKLTQYRAMKDAIQFPPTLIGTTEELQEESLRTKFPAVLQFNKGHSGNTTFVLQCAQDLAPHKKNFPKREARLVSFVEGRTYTLNGLVGRNGKAYTGSISFQLTGLPEATTNQSSTVGNDFGAAAQQLSAVQTQNIAEIAQKVGAEMRRKGYYGLFGIDVIVEEGSGTVYIIEVNTHQPASISFEAKLHRKIGKTPLLILCIRDMLNEDFAPSADELPPIILPFAARQIIYRNKQNEAIPAAGIHAPDGVDGVIPTRARMVGPNEELFRVQEYE